MRKLNLFLLLMISLFTLSFTNVYSITAGQYYVDTTVETNRLDYGVLHTKAIGYTATPLSGYNADGTGPSNQMVVPGQFYPQQVNVLEVPASSGAKIVNWAFFENHRWHLKTVRATIADYESKNPGWRVVAAINGDFFDIGATGNLPYQTSNSVVNDGEYYKPTTTVRNVGITNDGTTNSLIGGVAPQRTDTMRLAVYDENNAIINVFNINQINQAPGANQTAIYYANYGSDKQIIPVNVNVGSNQGFFVDDAELALANNPSTFYGIGTISSTESKTIGVGQFSIVTNNQDVIDALGVGVRIRAQWEYKGVFEGVSVVAGSGDVIMKDGNVNTLAGLANRASRTVIGKKADGTIVMMVVDGRQSNIDMYGADYHELAAIMKHHGAVDAYNLDGGGSSTIIIRDGDDLRLMNTPSDGRERTNSNALLIVTREPEFNYEVVERTETTMKINVDVVNNYSHHIDKLFVRVNNVSKEVVDGAVEFTNLRANREYRVDFFYQTPLNREYQILYNEDEWTLKRQPTFMKINLAVDDNSFTFTPLYIDQDQATDLKVAKIIVNDIEYNFDNGVLVLNRSEVQSIDNVILVYNVDRNDDPITIRMVNPHFYSTMALNGIVENQRIFIANIYK